MWKARDLIIQTAILLSNLAQAEIPDPREVFLNSMSGAGTGCPEGSFAGSLSPNAQELIVLIESFVAEAGPGIPLSLGRKACALNFDIHVPRGWQYSVLTSTSRGFLDLERGTTATQQVKMYFQGQLAGPTLPSNFVGPRVGDYVVRDVLGLSQALWSPCGINRSLNIQSSIRVSAAGGRRALATADSLDGEFRNKWTLQWRRC